MFDVRNISLALAQYLTPLRKANWKVILLCVTTAATFWFFRALNKIYTTRISYPVELAYNRDSLIALKDPPEEIPINVTGGGWQLLKKTISVDVDPVVIKPENPVQTHFFTAANLLPIFSSQLKDLDLNYIATDTIFFKIEPFKERKLSIKLDSSNIHLKENFYITSNLFIEPDSVIFRGPLSLVDRLPDVFKVTLSDKNINSRFDEELSLDLFSSSMIKKTPEVIHITFEVEEYIDQTAKLSIEQVNFPYDSTAFILNSTIDVTFKLQKKFQEQNENE